MTDYERYCYIRDAKKLTDTQVAELADVTKSTFTDWKTGRSKPKSEKLKKIADVLGTTTDYILFGIEQLDGEEYSKQIIQYALSIYHNNVLKQLVELALTANSDDEINVAYITLQSVINMRKPEKKTVAISQEQLPKMGDDGELHSPDADVDKLAKPTPPPKLSHNIIFSVNNRRFWIF